MDVVSLGPIALSTDRFIAVLAIGAFLISAWIMGKRKEDLRGWETGVLVAGMVVSRLAYVVTHLSAYGASPITALFFWQGGFSAVGALAGGVGWTVWRFRRRVALVPPALLPILIGLLFWAVPTSIQSLSDGPRPSLPSISLNRLGGGEIDFGGLPDRPVVVNIWATWCPPCRREMPMLAEVAGQSRDVLFVFVNQGESAETINAYLGERGLTVPNVVLDPQSRLTRHFGVRALPTTLFFSRDAVLVDAHVGEISRTALTDGIERLTDMGRSGDAAATTAPPGSPTSS